MSDPQQSDAAFLRKGGPKRLIGMVHAAPLPGTPRSSLGVREIIARARRDAEALREAGFDAVLVENMGDRPYLRAPAGPETTAIMAVLAAEVKDACRLPCGIQILAGANREALAAALAADLDFIRAEGFAFAHVADEGVIEACAGDLLRYRRAIGADHIAIYADIKKKHSSHAITADVSLAETACAAEFFLADGVIVTGAHTGSAADPEDAAEASAATALPVLIGSGITAENAVRFLEHADALIVGSSIKAGGDWRNEVDPKRAAALVEAAR